jgi:hypothetical protein
MLAATRLWRPARAHNALVTDQLDFDGCSRSCRPRKKPRKHTFVWGQCAHAERPEQRINIGPRVFKAEDGEMSIGYETFTLTQMADKVEAALRSVEARLGPYGFSARGAAGGLTGAEYQAMALAVARMLAGDE